MYRKSTHAQVLYIVYNKVMMVIIMERHDDALKMLEGLVNLLVSFVS